MAELDGRLPCCDSAYNVLKKGRMSWPPSSRVLEFFHAMGRGWLAAGADASRVSLRNLDWTEEETTFLLEHAGVMTLKAIARALGRSTGAARTKLGGKGLGVSARANQGFLSAAEIAQQYRCPYHRVRELLKAGTLPGRFDVVRNRWCVDPADLKPVEALLRAPKTHSYTQSPPDVGDYYERYGLRRSVRNGRTVVVSR